MSDTKNGSDSPSKSTSDAIFMMECLKHTQNSITVDISKVAAALNYKNPVSVANRIRVLKKQFGLEISCSNGSANGANFTGSPRKGAKAAQSRGPIKATADGSDAPTTAGKKRGRKPKAAKVANDEEVDTIKNEPDVKMEDGNLSDEEGTVKKEDDEA